MSFDPAGPSRLITPLDFPTFADDFESSSLANLPSFQKRSPTTLSSVRFWYAVWKLSAVHDRAINHWIYAESWNTRTFRFFFLFLFFFLLPLTFRGRRCIFVARLSLCRAHAGTKSLGSISPCLRFRAASYHSRFRVAVCDAYRLQQEFHAHTKVYAFSNDYLKARESTSRAVAKCISRCVIPPRYSRLKRLEQLQYILKNVLLRMYGDYMNTSGTSFRNTWRQIRTYRHCDEHYNQSWQRMHIDSPKIKD